MQIQQLHFKLYFLSELNLSFYFRCKQIDGRTNGWTDGQTDERMDGKTDVYSDGQTDKRMEGCMDCMTALSLSSCCSRQPLTSLRGWAAVHGPQGDVVQWDPLAVQHGGQPHPPCEGVHGEDAPRRPALQPVLEPRELRLHVVVDGRHLHDLGAEGRGLADPRRVDGTGEARRVVSVADHDADPTPVCVAVAHHCVGVGRHDIQRHVAGRLAVHRRRHDDGAAPPLHREAAQVAVANESVHDCVVCIAVRRRDGADRRAGRCRLVHRELVPVLDKARCELVDGRDGDLHDGRRGEVGAGVRGGDRHAVRAPPLVVECRLRVDDASRRVDVEPPCRRVDAVPYRRIRPGVCVVRRQPGDRRTRRRILRDARVVHGPREHGRVIVDVRHGDLKQGRSVAWDSPVVRCHQRENVRPPRLVIESAGDLQTTFTVDRKQAVRVAIDDAVRDFSAVAVRRSHHDDDAAHRFIFRDGRLEGGLPAHETRSLHVRSHHEDVHDGRTGGATYSRTNLQPITSLTQCRQGRRYGDGTCQTSWTVWNLRRLVR